MEDDVAKGRSIEEIDAKIVGLMAAIRDLRERRNALVPISKIQPEVLSHVFLLIRDSAIHNDPRNKRWLVAAHICRSWRSLAFATPQFWNQVDIISGRNRWAKHLLARLGSTCPIHLVSLWRFQGSESFVDQIFAMQHRLRKLVIRNLVTGSAMRRLQAYRNPTDPEPIDPHTGELLSLEATTLEHLSVEADAWSEQTLSLDSHFMLSCYKTLRHLDVIGVTLTAELWTHPAVVTLLKHLRTLRILFPTTSDSASQDKGLAMILDGICNIEDITLTYAASATAAFASDEVGPAESTKANIAGRLCRYPRLRRAQITDLPVNVIGCLNILGPQQASLDISGDFRDETEAYTYLLMPLVLRTTSLAQIRNNQPLKCLLVRLFCPTDDTRGSHTVLSIQGWPCGTSAVTRTDCFRFLSEGTEPHLSLSARFTFEVTKGVLSHLPDICRLFGIATVSTLCALVHRKGHTFASNVLQPLLDMELTCPFVLMMLKDLRQKIDTSLDPQLGWPNLEALGICVEHEYAINENGDKIRSWLQERSSQGHNIPTLHLAFLGGLHEDEEDWMESLRAFGGEVQYLADFASGIRGPPFR